MSALRKTRKAKASRSATAKTPKKPQRAAPSADSVTVRKILNSHLPARDRTQFLDNDLQAISDNFLRFIENRKAGQIKLQALNPSAAKDGYTSRHSVIMIANDDMPFLVDSVTAELNCLNVGMHLVIHPIVSLIRNAKGDFDCFAGSKHHSDELVRESWMYIEIDETEPKQLEEISNRLEKVLHNVRLAVQDWQTMRGQVIETMRDLPHNSVAGLPEGEREETGAFLSWLESDHFTFLGMRDYKVQGKGKARRLEIDPSSSLGILRDAQSVMFFTDEGEGAQPSDIHHFLERKQLALVTKTHRRSLVHRATPMDAILIKRFDDAGELIGERLFIGLFTSSFYNGLPNDVPLIRSKIDYVIGQAKLDPRSHNGKALAHILNTFPRDELFQISREELLETALGILHLQERQRLALFIRHDAFSRFVNCLIFVPRERYDSKLRHYFQNVLIKTFNGVSADYNVKITNDSLAQIFIVVRTAKGQIPAYDKSDLERSLQEASRGWQGRLQDALVSKLGENKGLRLAHRYDGAFPDAYCDNVKAAEALVDIDFIEETRKSRKLEVHLYQPTGTATDRLSIKWYSPDQSLSLSQIMPMMEHMGLMPDAEDGPHAVKPHGAAVPVWVHDCHARVRELPADFNLPRIKDKFEDCLRRLWTGEVEADNYNRLVLLAELSWREVVILRAIGKYLHQIRMPYSDVNIRQTLAAHPHAARLLVNLFMARFDPAQQKNGARATAKIEEQILDYLRGVTRVDQDRILRRYLNVIQNTLRTNYFQTTKDGQPKEHLSFKLDSKKIDDLPLPRPHVEIFVYSPKVEGIHLRGGKVARGGLRWSDRRDDFRTEVLSLMKAQQVKNTVIVPVGSKGGFVVKTPNPPDMAKEGVSCYQTYIRALLDITDNRKGEKIIPPANVVRHDGDDPYLVVAADKGTAKFSDIANAISIEYGFWLDDAFASGGSAGYDHKGMGITARGAWEAVKRHFREMGVDTQKQDFNVIGVGDMAGDVFGNGMLLSQHIRLVGAFNHKHIFLDPTPDAAKSFKERQRLFDLPGSQWSDYDKKLISKGGGIYNRDAKTIALSKEARDALGVKEAELPPDDVIRAMLRAQVDLLWFGGIGTYVKSSEESHADAGDRTNDQLRVNAEEIRAKVIGEGANLGLTQRGRIAYAMNGGRLNTDAIDNSAGVDTSDHEVNIKILLSAIVRENKLETKSRNQLLARMTDDVAKLVLRDNYLQTLAITVSESRAAELLPQHARLIQQLERSGILNRKVEFLPDDDEIQDRLRTGKGLTRPELAVLMGYAKIALYDELVASNLPDNPALEDDLFLYFPKTLRETYPDYIRKHRLRREIIATFTTNSVVNRAGIHFVMLMKDKTGKEASDIASAYSLVRDIYDMRAMWKDVERLDGKIPAAVQTDLFSRLGKMVERSAEWYLRNTDLANTTAIKARHQQAVKTVRQWLEKRESTLFAGNGTREKLQEYKDAGVPEAVIRNVLFLPLLALVPEIENIATRTGQKLEVAAELYFAVEERFHLQWLRKEAQQMVPENHWQREALGRLVEDYYQVQAGLTQQALTSAGHGNKAGKTAKDAKAQIALWMDARNIRQDDFDLLITDMAGATRVHMAQLDLALRYMQPWAAPVAATAPQQKRSK